MFRSRFRKADRDTSTRWPIACGVAPLLALSLAACTGSGTTETGGATSPSTASALAPSINAPPAIRGTPPSTATVGATFSFRPSSFDPDGDPLLYSVQNRPAWMSLDFRTGELSGVPGVGDVGVSSGIVISVSDNKATVSLEAFTVTVVPPSNRPPTIAGSPSTTAIVGQAYVFQASGADPDADRLVYDIVDKPRWAEFDTATGRLQGTPTNADVGSTGAISIGVSDGRFRTTLEAFSIQVQPIIPPAPAASSVPRAAEPQGPASSAQPPSPPDPSTTTSTAPETARQNRAPSISGAPMTSITVGSAYAFVPVATDADGDRLTFSILNRPAWASFDPASGRLAGIPATSSVGTTTGVVIMASDGTSSARLPAFDLRVVASNRSPVISGSPPTTVDAGRAYSFSPSAEDADDDPLTFTVSNRPSWASFDSRTGRLAGTPAATDVGSFSGIGISVSDGRATDSLQAFTITVRAGTTSSITLDWDPPTTNSDGTPLTDLAGYRLRYGTSPASLGQLVDIPNSSLTSYVVDGLTPGVWYFVLRAYNRRGAEGLPSDLTSGAVD
jgi:hypothetical protein